MGAIADEFGAIVSSMQGGTSDPKNAVRFGRIKRDRELAEGASLFITLDKEDFALATRRMKAYQNIPFHTGGFVMDAVGKFIMGPDGPVQRAFRDETEPDGTKWEELSEAEARWRRHGGRGEKIWHPILDDELSEDDPLERLKEAATSWQRMSHTTITGQYARLVLSPEHLEGKARYKFFVHQVGSNNGWGLGITIPARPFFPDGPEDLTGQERRKLEAIVDRKIKEGVEERAAQYSRRSTK